MERDAAYWIHHLRLTPHPEGGYYSETYRAAEGLAAAHLPARFGGSRSLSTSIFFLLEGGQVSKFHRLKADEVWHFYDGGALTLHVIDPAGMLTAFTLGLDAVHGERPQAVVRAGCWFGATLARPESFALVGCTVAPGFDFKDFELGERGRFLRKFPDHGNLIRRLT